MGWQVGVAVENTSLCGELRQEEQLCGQLNRTDVRGLLTGVNLIVATNHNAAPIAMSAEKAAKGMIKGGNVSEGLLNTVEMAFRAYDPCHACATHALGETPLSIEVWSSCGDLVRRIVRG